MLIISLGASVFAGFLGAVAAYFMGFGVAGVAIAYAVAGQVTFASIIAMLTAPPEEEAPDFQRQVELDLLALKEEMMREKNPNKRVDVFRKELNQHRPRDKRVPRPFNPTA